jgi:hypothetical protein
MLKWVVSYIRTVPNFLWTIRPITVVWICYIDINSTFILNYMILLNILYYILFYFILFYFTLFYLILLYFILFYVILFYFTLFYFTLFYFILLYFILFYFTLLYFILFYFILFYFILCYIILLVIYFHWAMCCHLRLRPALTNYNTIISLCMSTTISTRPILSTTNRHCFIYALTFDNVLNVVLSAYFYYWIPSSALRQSLWLKLIQSWWWLSRVET